jgi:hypothetical protein
MFEQNGLSQQIHRNLWILVSGLSAYLLYGIGMLRPEIWLISEPNLLISRLTVASLVFGCGLLALSFSRAR